MAALKIQRNDTVQVMTGSEKDRNRQGRVLRVFPGEDKVLVQGIRVIKKNVKPNPQKNIKGGVAEQEAKLNVSNVMLVCPDCGPTRVGFRFEGEGEKRTKVRVCRKCDKVLPTKK
ncbi:50S ribosomal protein L24 [Acidipila sp. EB88]|uniref:50S ribosomal protein L24 n=1 Tax=Acidipila sp. EB88 TaxID=2305226 RepID=UPI000F5E382C|nr:50S ribosomal protein L24 [Acidipila sp. EB88]RRA47818.1 50S ribosomal protein L24 [Acidipila sp. EB88]